MINKSQELNSKQIENNLAMKNAILMPFKPITFEIQTIHTYAGILTKKPCKRVSKTREAECFFQDFLISMKCYNLGLFFEPSATSVYSDTSDTSDFTQTTKS
jgi:hypothetical protein